MSASSTSNLNPMALPFSSCALFPWQLYAAAPAGCFVQPECLYPPACGVAVACGCSWCGGGFLSGGADTYAAVGVPAFPPPAWVPVQYLPPPPPVTVVCSPPPLSPPASQCSITEIVDDRSLMAEGDDEPSPRSVLTPWRRPKPTAVLPPKRPAVKLLKRRAAHPPPPPSSSYGDKAAFDPNSNKTSLMICNIPNNFSKRRLMAILDQHCAEENDMLLRLRRGGGGVDCAVVKSEYDFLYVPIDFRTTFNKGYAFVNMTTATAARRLHAFLHGHRWGAVGSQKVCQVVHARIEGIEAFMKHFDGTSFPCRDKELLPVRFGPARDGSRRTAERVVGHLQARLLR